ncbi:hypothetical protein F9C07_2281525 [Aspergillus flavus]|uniref:Uncharacterized protein n=1 Tax=Aspergillus flavus (strain ATCC 200026 / FGSC A1120 / IAM 13836 / NRRL 3357 / JCM 12722 / SRRC 167) TaxID=332952 RepID=A0A7U2QWH6_ASPFN|nr:hypothetical protein F9C07_2281525 [Aspergillus flavus]
MASSFIWWRSSSVSFQACSSLNTRNYIPGYSWEIGVITMPLRPKMLCTLSRFWMAMYLSRLSSCSPLQTTTSGVHEESGRHIRPLPSSGRHNNVLAGSAGIKLQAARAE